jgi:hypothetical protein
MAKETLTAKCERLSGQIDRQASIIDGQVGIIHDQDERLASLSALSVVLTERVELYQDILNRTASAMEAQVEIQDLGDDLKGNGEDLKIALDKLS